MPIPHLNIRIVQRSKGSSAVAGAAYQAGEKLFSEYDQKNKDHRRKQKEVVYTEIMLPANAPPEYADRETLWNSAEEVEKQWNSQLARRFVVALPREVPLEMCPQMLQEYCEEYFVSKGMCCDIAIHDPDPPGHNPHCHIMLTMRAIDENGKETVDTYNTGENRGREVSHSLNYQKLGRELMSQDELAVMDGGKCVLQLRGVRPFLSNKYDITKHPNYKYTSDFDKRNELDIERFLSHRLRLKPDEVCEVYEANPSGTTA